MRQYRGKCKDNGEWVYGWYVYHPFRDRHFIIPIDAVIGFAGGISGIFQTSGVYEVIPETVGQQIGKQDRNGKEIWEFDRVRITAAIDMFNDDGSISMAKGERYEDCIVRFLDGAFWFGYEKTLYDKHLLRMILNDGNWRGEVIGNIHDNPKLSKDE